MSAVKYVGMYIMFLNVGAEYNTLFNLKVKSFKLRVSIYNKIDIIDRVTK